jgi:hypothetical protein
VGRPDDIHCKGNMRKVSETSERRAESSGKRSSVVRVSQVSSVALHSSHLQEIASRNDHSAHYDDKARPRLKAKLKATTADLYPSAVYVDGPLSIRRCSPSRIFHGPLCRQGPFPLARLSGFRINQTCQRYR